MPARKRHGRLDPVSDSEQKPNFHPVTDVDCKAFSGLVLWAARYINHVYEHGRYDGGPIQKRWSEAVYWQTSQIDHTEPRLFVAARGLAFPISTYSGEEARRDIARQVELGIELDIERTTVPYEEERHTTEIIELSINADQVVFYGSYRWYGSRVIDQPAPSTEFSNVDDGHNKGISVRAAYLLGEFRNLSLKDSAGRIVNYAGGLNQAAAIVPEELVEIPI